jgi:CheY-like chemotaxis protein
VVFDRKILRQVLLNLLSNAIKFTKPGGEVYSHTTCRRSSSPAPAADHRQTMDVADTEGKDHHPTVILEIAVHDTGIGIDESDIDKLFKMFSQIDSEKSREMTTTGTGVGLALTKELLRIVDGTIRVESKPGVGSTFVVSVPLMVDRSTAARTSGRQRRQTSIGIRCGSNRDSETSMALGDGDQSELELVDCNHCAGEDEGGDDIDYGNSVLSQKNVLIVDDNFINRKIYSTYVLEWSAVPYLASSADEAMMYLVDCSVDFSIILVDIFMPKVDGMQFARAVVDRGIDVPMVAISSISDIVDDDHRRLFHARLVKPLTRSCLFTVCRRLVTSFSGHRHPSSPKHPGDDYCLHHQACDSTLCLPREQQCCNDDDDDKPQQQQQQRGMDDNGNEELELCDGSVRLTRDVLDRIDESHFDSSSSTHMISSPSPGKKSSTLVHVVQDYASLRVLLVDDNRINRQVGTAMLKSLGINNIDVADCGESAIRRIEENDDSYDVIFIDIKMPGMDGYELAHRVRHVIYGFEPEERTPYLIAMTAHVMDRAKERSLEVGMNSFISKPVTLRSVDNQLSVVIDRKNKIVGRV